MMSNTKRSLFGGTLLAAGLTVAAHAQQFDLSFSAAYTYARDYAYGLSDMDWWFGAGPFSAQAAVINNATSVQGSASASLTHIEAAASLSGFGGIAYGYVVSYFTVSQDVNASLAWNWIDHMDIFDESNGNLIFSANWHSSGSEFLSLVAGTEYSLRASAFVGGHEMEVSSSWQIEVPVPGSAGILGLAGLSALARRRPAPPRTEAISDISPRG